VSDFTLDNANLSPNDWSYVGVLFAIGGSTNVNFD
jgi:hypothetical protein